MTTHAQGLALARTACTTYFGEFNDGEMRAVAGVACYETHYSDGWRGAGGGSNNMGAEQCGSGYKGDRFVYVDTHPNADGTSTKYRAEFRRYPTKAAGMLALVPIVLVNRGRETVREAARAGDWGGVSAELHRTGYYEGFGATVADRIANHKRALVRSIYSARGETAPRMPVAGLPTLRKGSTLREAVVVLQRELRAAADGLFGPVTEALVKRAQRDCGIAADGVVGPTTWRILMGDDYTPETLDWELDGLQ
jgi:hypothetical protein